MQLSIIKLLPWNTLLFENISIGFSDQYSICQYKKSKIQNHAYMPCLYKYIQWTYMILDKIDLSYVSV